MTLEININFYISMLRVCGCFYQVELLDALQVDYFFRRAFDEVDFLPS